MSIDAPRLRFAVVGCGSIGSRHARNLHALGVPELALCDLDRRRAIHLASEVEATVVTDDLDAVLTQYRPQAVLVCTPPATHLAVAARAAEGGAHVFCEQPLAPDLDGVDALLELIEARGRFLMTGMCYRFHRGLRRLQQRVAGGTVGRLIGAQLWGADHLPAWADRIHALDTLRWALGEPLEVIGMPGKLGGLEVEAEDVSEAILRLEGGAVAEVHFDALQCQPRNRCEVVGSEGSLVWDFAKEALSWRRPGDEVWNVEPIGGAVNDMYVAELCEFIDCVASDRRPALDGSEARATLALAAAIRESAETGRAVELPVPPRRSFAEVG